MAIKILLVSSVGLLGIFLGTQIAEAALIVPYWKGLSPDDFFYVLQNIRKKITSVLFTSDDCSNPFACFYSCLEFIDKAKNRHLDVDYGCVYNNVFFDIFCVF